MRNKGIIVKVKDSYCIILSGGGAYHKIPLSRVVNPRIGAETEFFPVSWVNRVKPLLMVACLLVFVLGLNMYRMAAESAPAAYVSLDINPSVELEVNKNLKVITARPINQDAENLLKGMELKGKDLYFSVRQILDKAENSGYIKPDQTNYILSAVTASEESSDLINYDNMAKNLEQSMENKELDVEFVLISTDINTRNEAKNKGVSAGKLVVYKNSLNSGEKITLQQVKQNSLTKLVNTYKVRLVPANKKGYAKIIHLPLRSRRLLKKQSSGPEKDIQTQNPDLRRIEEEKAQEQLTRIQKKLKEDLKKTDKGEFKEKLRGKITNILNKEHKNTGNDKNEPGKENDPNTRDKKKTSVKVQEIIKAKVKIRDKDNKSNIKQDRTSSVNDSLKETPGQSPEDSLTHDPSRTKKKKSP